MTTPNFFARAGCMMWALLIVHGPGNAQQRIAHEGSPQVPSAMRAIQGFIKALNAEDPEEMFLFYEDGVTDAFRARQSREEDRAMYERIRTDLGLLAVSGIRRTSPDQAEASAFSQKQSKTVRFVFDIEAGKIAGFRIRPGDGPDGEGPDFAIPAGLTGKAMEDFVDKELTRRARADTFSGVVLLAKGDTPVFLEAYGLANREASIPITTDTRFDIGSITKMMTKVAVAQLVAGGKLELQETILDHLPDYPDRGIAAKITVQHLLDHSSGLGDLFNDRWESAPKEQMKTPRDFFPVFTGLPLAFEPGSGQRYSNAGYIVLGAIVEAASGLDYARYVEEKIFRPADMTRSGFPLRDGTKADLAIGYTTGEMDGEEPGDLRSNLGSLPIRGCPAGSSSHTASDLLKFDRALRQHRLLPAEWTAWVFKGSLGEAAETGVEASGIALGGGGPGVSATIVSDAETSVVVLSNRDPSATGGMAMQMARALRR